MTSLTNGSSLNQYLLKNGIRTSFRLTNATHQEDGTTVFDNSGPAYRAQKNAYLLVRSLLSLSRSRERYSGNTLVVEHFHAGGPLGFPAANTCNVVARILGKRLTWHDTVPLLICLRVAELTKSDEFLAAWEIDDALKDSFHKSWSDDFSDDLKNAFGVLIEQLARDRKHIQLVLPNNEILDLPVVDRLKSKRLKETKKDVPSSSWKNQPWQPHPCEARIYRGKVKAFINWDGVIWAIADGIPFAFRLRTREVKIGDTVVIEGIPTLYGRFPLCEFWETPPGYNENLARGVEEMGKGYSST